jgi:hypothetical protein
MRLAAPVNQARARPGLVTFFPPCRDPGRRAVVLGVAQPLASGEQSMLSCAR